MNMIAKYFGSLPLCWNLWGLWICLEFASLKDVSVVGMVDSTAELYLHTSELCHELYLLSSTAVLCGCLWNYRACFSASFQCEFCSFIWNQLCRLLIDFSVKKRHPNMSHFFFFLLFLFLFMLFLYLYLRKRMLKTFGINNALFSLL